MARSGKASSKASSPTPGFKAGSSSKTESVESISSCESVVENTLGSNSGALLLKIESALSIANATKGSISKKNLKVIIDCLTNVKPVVQSHERLNTELKNLTKSFNIAQSKVTSLESQLKKTTKAPSYAQVLSRPAGQKVQPKPAAQFTTTLITKQGETTGNLIDSIKKLIIKHPKNVSVVRFASLSKNKVVIYSQNSEAKDALDSLLATNGYNVVTFKKLNPPLLLKGIPADIEQGKLVDYVTQCNTEVFDNEAPKLLYVKSRPNRKRYNAALRVTPEARKIILNTMRGKLRLGIGLVHVEDADPTVQCTNCYRFGHTKKICNSTNQPNERTVCWRCTENHHSKDCQKDQSSKMCSNCKSKSLPHGHAPTDPNCPVYRHHHQIAISRINY